VRRVFWHPVSLAERLRRQTRRNLDVFWLRDKSLSDRDNLPEPDDLAEEIIENL
jgi:type I restriction enzyme M protein